MKIRQVVGMVGRTLRVLIEPGSLVELRVPQSEKGAQCGLFDDRNEMAVAAAKLSRKVPGVFFTLNPVKPSAGKAANQIGTATRAVRDADILCRRWLDLDFDPVRPGKCPAKKGEHETAIATARECRNFLRALGWPEPVLADSGNGAHLYYRIALSNDEESDALVKAVLKALTLRFSTPKVTLDEGNGNASRLTRVFGTMNCKGEETEHRVYRRARLLKVPEKIDVVSPKLLKQLVAKLPPRSVNTVGQQLDVGKWLSDHNVPIAFHAPWNRGHKWVLASCPWNEAHEKSAVVVQFADGGIAALCLHKSCSGTGWPQMRKMLGDVNRNPLLPVGGQRNRQTSQIIDLVARDIRPYRSLQGDAYVAVDFDDHSKNYGVGTKAFHQYLMGKYYEAFQIVPQPGAIQQAVTHFSALAQLEGPVEPVFIRAGNYGQAYYLDLGNDHWEAVEFSKDGWAVVKKPPVHFRRAQGMLPLPRPSEKGDINELREFVNIGTDEAWLLFVACLVSAILPRGPHPILGIHGEQGSGKTTVAKIFRQMIDPNSVPLRAMPKDIRDFAVAAHNSWVVSFDNLSFLPVWFSDSLCRLSSGGGGAALGCSTPTARRPFLRGNALLSSTASRNSRPEPTSSTALCSSSFRSFGNTDRKRTSGLNLMPPTLNCSADCSISRYKSWKSCRR